MDRNQIEIEAEKYCPLNINIEIFIEFAEHIAKLTRQETLSEVKAALDKMQDGKK